MHSLSVRFIAVLWVIGIANAVPLGIEYDKTTGLSAAETANKGRLDTATSQAHAQVGKMREGLTKYKAGDAKATALYEAAFGKNADFNEVDKTVTALENGKIKANVATHPFTGGEIAAVPWSKASKSTPWTAGNAQFSSQFHGAGANGLNDAGRAGTIIHEATHQLSKTGDDVNLGGNIIKANDGSSKPSGATGYTSNHNMHTTVAQVNADQDYTDVRDKAKNMHHNAESYAVFGSLCSQPGALRRRDVRLYNRALLEDDHKQLQHLARRNSCQLPPDYFAKKAAAKKAAAQKAASGHVEPALHSKVATKGGLKHSVASSVHAAKGLRAKSTNAGHQAKSRTAKVPHTVKASNALRRNGKKQATKGVARTTVRGAKAAHARKQTVQRSKSPQAHSRKPSPRRGTSRVAAAHPHGAAGAKRVVSKATSKRSSKLVQAVLAKGKRH